MAVVDDVADTCTIRKGYDEAESKLVTTCNQSPSHHNIESLSQYIIKSQTYIVSGQSNKLP